MQQASAPDMTAPEFPPQLPSIKNEEYFANARALLLQECCLPVQHLQTLAPVPGFGVVLNIRTTGEEDLVGYVPGMRRLYKHIFLQNREVKKHIVDYYRALGYGWCDIVALNRTQWKIFLWPKN